ncbi:hypothetical protein HDU97_001990 [Phlyctochytrium planicorne]|nr:hypothetical protein HDU97_001990 [Phlyctochytrium planicorne]
MGDCSIFKEAFADFALLDDCCNFNRDGNVITCDQTKITAIKLSCDFGAGSCNVKFRRLMELAALTKIDLVQYKVLDGLFPGSAPASQTLQDISIRDGFGAGVRLNMGSIQSYSQLRRIVLSNMQLEGTVPSLAGLGSLSDVDLSNNRLQGDVTELISRFNNGRLRTLSSKARTLTRAGCVPDPGIQQPSSTQVPVNPIPSNPGTNPSNPQNPNPNPNSPNPAQNPVTSSPNPANVTATVPASQLEPGLTEDFLSPEIITIDGQTFTTTKTSRITRSRTLKPTADTLPNAQTGRSGDNFNPVPIVGSAVGTLVVCVAGVLLALFLIRRRRTRSSERGETYQEPAARWIFKTGGVRSQRQSTTRYTISDIPTAHLQAPDITDVSNGSANGHVVTFSSALILPFNEEAEVKEETHNLAKESKDDGDRQSADGASDSESLLESESSTSSLALETERSRRELSPGHFMLAWTPANVISWLKTLAIRKAVIDIFEAREIDGPMLAALTEHDLEHDFCIQSQYARTAILSSIEELLEGPETAATSRHGIRVDDDGPPGIEEGDFHNGDMPPPYIGRSNEN